MDLIINYNSYEAQIELYGTPDGSLRHKEVSYVTFPKCFVFIFN